MNKRKLKLENSKHVALTRETGETRKQNWEQRTRIGTEKTWRQRLKTG